MEQLFSYGTLQSKEIQMQVFNKLLSGTEDQLAGYKLKDLQIEEFGMKLFCSHASENFGCDSWYCVYCF
jgi:hypothetical protein